MADGARGWAGRLRRRPGTTQGTSQPTSQGAGPEAPDAEGPPAGRRPEVERRDTNLGEALDDAVHLAESRMPVGVDREHDLVREEFDALHYLLQRRELIGRDDVDLVAHFLEHGVSDRSDPQPHFSMENYLREHPEAGAGGEHPYVAWLDHGRAAGELADPVPRLDLLAPLLGMEAHELAERVVDRRTDLVERMRTGRLGEMIARAAELEPLIGRAWPAMTRPLLFPTTTLDVVAGMSALHRAQQAADFRTARVVLVVNEARRAADLGLEGHLTRALARHVDPDEIVVVHTDASVARPSDRHPDGVRQVDFAACAADLPRGDDPDDADAADPAEEVLVTLLRSFRADAIVNVRSRLLFRAMRTFTPALAASERLFYALSGNSRTPMGSWDGWAPHYFYRTFDRVAGVITDSEFFERYLAETYLVPPAERERLHLLRAPVDPDLAPVPRPARPPGARPQVFWAGPWTRQRGVSTVLELAERMPDVDVRVWTPGRVAAPEGGAVPPNLVVRSGRPRTADLPLQEADVWLHTAEWEGVPQRLLEVAMAAVPIVGVPGGGAGDVIGDGAWPVEADAGADAYEAAVRSVLADPDGARSRTAALRERLVRERSPEVFAEQAARLLLLDRARGEGDGD